MLDLSLAARLEKNKMASDGAFIILLEIAIEGQQIIRVCRNTSDIQFNGATWTAFPFEFGAPIGSSGDGSLPQFTVKISNVTRVIEKYLDAADGGVGGLVNVYVVVARPDGSNFDTELHETFSVQSTSCDVDFVTFTLTGAAYLSRRVPERKFLKLVCPFIYRGPECRSTSSFETCDKTLMACRLRDNAKRFGGEPAIPDGGLYIGRKAPR